MLHVLAGGLIGAAVGAASVVVLARLRGQPIDGAAAGSMALAGLVGGAVTAATLGAGAVVGAGGAARAVAASAAGGGAGCAAHRATTNVAARRPLHEGVLEAAATGAVVGGVSRGAGVALAPLGDRLVAPVAGRLLAPAAALPPRAAEAVRGVVAVAGDAAGAASTAYNVGAVGGATRRVLDDARLDRPLGEEVPEAARDAGVDALVRHGLGKVAAPAVDATLAGPRAGPAAPLATSTPSVPSSPTAAPAPSAPTPSPSIPPASPGLSGALDGAVGAR